jgi:pimeloyl-ACP methyl ester carboxylesterase
MAPLPAALDPMPAGPPAGLPPGRIECLDGRGELFVRDSGGSGPPVLLLHGWMFSADTNFSTTYGPLAAAGYRVLAIDHRGHGRGLRSTDPFRLQDCADDAAALVRSLGCGPVLVVGYSMGGPIGQLMARDHPDEVAGLICCATSMEWKDLRLRPVWAAMGALQALLGLWPHGLWRRLLSSGDLAAAATTEWVATELTRGSARDLAEAGRELGRFDSRAWVGRLAAPAAVVITTEDDLVKPRKQRALAQWLGAPTFEVAGDHSAVSLVAEAFNRALVAALADVVGRVAPGRRFPVTGTPSPGGADAATA